MDVNAALKGQYHAALAMLKQAIERCPEDVWLSGEHPRTVWRIASHALLFTHFYLKPGVEGFQPWEGHREECESLERMPWPPHDMPRVVEPYTKAEMLEYWLAVDGMIDAGVDRLDLDAPECGFPWYRMPKLDHQILNIRHTQEHAAQIAEHCRLAGVDVDWVG